LICKKRKNVGRPFRIDAGLLNVFNEEAEKQGVSVNSLLNRLLQQYAYLRYMMRYSTITLTRKGFTGILECCSDDEIKENGINAGSVITRTLLLTMGVTPNYTVVICLVEKLLSEFAGWFECDNHIKEDKEILHMCHDMGMKWSIYRSGAASGMFNFILKQEIGIEVSDSAISVTLDKQSIS
jgi:hypothetical protein